MLREISFAASCAVMACATPCWAQAITTDQPIAHTDPVAETAVTEQSLEPLTDDALGQLRGGESLTVANQTLVAITSGNVMNGDYTAGSVSLSDFALSNFNGVGNLLINTGAQVSLQTGMNLTINVRK
jgi:hypothetical protein